MQHYRLAASQQNPEGTNTASESTIWCHLSTAASQPAQESHHSNSNHLGFKEKQNTLEGKKPGE